MKQKKSTPSIILSMLLISIFCLSMLPYNVNAAPQSSLNVQTFGAISYAISSTSMTSPDPESTPTPTPIATAVPTPTPLSTTTPRPTPTITPTPTPIPTQSSFTKLNAIWLEHPDTEFLNQNQQTILQHLLDANVKIVMVQVGNLQSSGGAVSVNAWTSASVLQQTINSIHTYSSNIIKVHAWISYIPSSPISLSSSSARNNAISAVVNFCNQYGFDGVNDDTYESFSGSNQNYIDYANALAVTLHNSGKVCSYDMPTWFSGGSSEFNLMYSGINQMDYACPMFYGTMSDRSYTGSAINSLLNSVLAVSAVPVLGGLAAPNPAASFSAQLSAIGHPSNAKFTGVSVWSITWMTSTDWAAYKSWAQAS